MRLKSRLTRLQSQAGCGVSEHADETGTSELRQRLARLRPEHRSARPGITRPRLSERDLAHRLGGGLVAEGLIRIRRRIPLAGRCGVILLSELEREPRLPGETRDTARPGCYFDTETTGLSGGCGTLAFLLGMAYLNQDAIVLEQWLLTRFAAEPALLSAFAAALNPDDRLISYNGKCYDLPLLLTRYRIQALPHPFTTMPHLDLLHPVRRLFGRRWPDCRLATLEHRLLGLSREHDLPGAAAPQAWFDYVRRGEADRLIRVVEHNSQDILSLVLAHRMLSRASVQPDRFEVDLTALARWQMQTDPAAARQLLQSHPEALDDDGRRLLGRLTRREGDWDQAVAIWRELAAKGCIESIERLAKYHEHISGNLVAARDYSERLPATTRHRQRRLRLAEKLALRQNSLFAILSPPPE